MSEINMLQIYFDFLFF